MRLFLACKIEPSPKYLEIIEDLKHLLRHDKISWAEPKIAHLTLKFFGETPDYRIKKINKNIFEACSNIDAFDFSLSKIGAFGSSYKPQIIWFGTTDENDLKQVHSEIMNALNPIGYFPDQGNFVPHATIARISKTTDKQWFWKCIEKYQTEFIQNVEVNELYLFESKLTPEKAIHKIVERYPLKKV